MKYNSNYAYDLKVGQVKEKELGEIFETKTIEVKNDLKARETGNVFVEYQNKGIKSGISTTESEYYCFALGETFHIIKLEVLKQKCRKYLGTKRDVYGGDSNTSKGILLPLFELV